MSTWHEHAWKQVIDGAFVDGDGGAYPIVNPATEQVIGHAPEATVGQAEAAAAAARRAFPAWAATPPAERAALLRAAARRLRELEPDLLGLTIAETGATSLMGARIQVPTALARLERYARDAERPLDFAMSPEKSHATAFADGALLCANVNRLPVGVVACISPYNFPLANMVGKIAPALAVGCTVVMKPPVQDPLGILVLGEILHEVGFPPGVFNLISSQSAAPARALTASPDVDMVSFTGSSAVGADINSSGAPTMKRMLLELGGKGACIVLEGADVDVAVEIAANTWSFHSGQICTAPTRAIVHRGVYDEFVGKLAALAPTMPVGDPLDLATVVGPVISDAHRSRVERYIGAGEQEGATVVVDGRRPAHLDRGYYVGPTLLADCTPQMTPVREEIFGPVISVLSFEDEDEAIALANDSEFGLYSYLVAPTSAHGFALARNVRSNVSVNTGLRTMDAPFGGFKMSGIGRDGGDYGLYAYTEMQAVMWPA